MADQKSRPKRFIKGKAIKARDLNLLVDHALPEGTRATRQAKSDSKAILGKRYFIIEEKGDYLICLPQNLGVSLDDVVYIAKNYLNRRTPFENTSRAGISYTYSADSERAADNGSETEDQVIVPCYEPTDQIYAVSVINGTGVKTDKEDKEREVVLEDLNLDGRAWAKKAS